MSKSVTIDYQKEYEKIKAREKKAYERRNIRINLMLEKAKKAGIVVTEAEVDAEYAKKVAKK